MCDNCDRKTLDMLVRIKGAWDNKIPDQWDSVLPQLPEGMDIEKYNADPVVANEEMLALNGFKLHLSLLPDTRFIAIRVLVFLLNQMIDEDEDVLEKKYPKFFESYGFMVNSLHHALMELIERVMPHVVHEVFTEVHGLDNMPMAMISAFIDLGYDPDIEVSEEEIESQLH